MKSNIALKTHLTVAALALCLAGNSATAQQNPNNLVVNPGSGYQGQSYEDRETEWWQTMFSIQTTNGQHPLITGGAVLAPSGTMLLVPDPDSPATISVTVPNSTPIYIPIINDECSNLDDPPPSQGTNEAGLRACSESQIDSTANVSATIDGVAITSVPQHRLSDNGNSPFFSFTLPANNVFGEPAGTQGVAATDGYTLTLRPLSAGFHTIRVQGTFTSTGQTIDTTFLLTVQGNNLRTR